MIVTYKRLVWYICTEFIVEDSCVRRYGVYCLYYLVVITQTSKQLFCFFFGVTGGGLKRGQGWFNSGS